MAYGRDSSTSLVLVFPVWITKPFWKMLTGFRIIDYFATGSSLFVSPDWYIKERTQTLMHKSDTRWPVLVAYFGTAYQASRVYASVKKNLANNEHLARISRINKMNFVLSGMQSDDQSIVDWLSNRIQPIQIT